MNRIKYNISRLKRIKTADMLDTVKHVSFRCGKAKIIVLIDIIWCGFRYSAGFTDYDVFQMERTNSKQRRTFITRGVNDDYVKLLNIKEYRHFFENKDEFNTEFSKYLHRQWMIINGDKADEFKSWISGKEVLIAKPKAEMCGKGIQKLYVKDFSDINALFQYLLKSNCDLVEECLQQHEKLNKMYPGSINTIRLVTVYKNGNAKAVVSYFRMGKSENFVDNFISGGLLTRVDIETGKLMFDAVDHEGKIYAEHPDTKINIKGFTIPMWDDCIEMALNAAAVIPQVGYVGWDIAVTPDGPALVEGNEFPGHVMYQLPAHTPDNYGLLPLFNKIIFG